MLQGLLHSIPALILRVPIPFKVDRLNLRTDDRWARLVTQTHEQRVIWADNIMKINRKDMKVRRMVLMVT